MREEIKLDKGWYLEYKMEPSCNEGPFRTREEARQRYKDIGPIKPANVKIVKY